MKQWIVAVDLVRFESDGDCTIHCRTVCLNKYSLVYGLVETPTGPDNDGVLRSPAHCDYQFCFGPYITISKGTRWVFGAMAQYHNGEGFGGARFEGATIQRPRDGAPNGAIDFGRLPDRFASTRGIGYCGNRPCIRMRREGGPGGYTKVPEPGTLGLFGLGLIA